MIQVIKQDILAFPCDAIVSPASPDLLDGGGLEHEIRKRSGFARTQEHLDMVKAEAFDGGAYPSPARNIPVTWVLHATGSPYSNPDCEAIYSKLFESVLAMCINLKIKSIAFPALGMGYFGVPPEVGAAWMKAGLEKYPDDMQITICAIDDDIFNALNEVFA